MMRGGPPSGIPTGNNLALPQQQMYIPQHQHNSLLSGGSSVTQDEVIKFLLKLKNNNLQNLKNALRKLGERTQGNKDQLLLRLANKLATPEGKAMVRAQFKPEIYRQLYEVEFHGSIQ